uniref:Uncharacterized protein n=1 Tax=Rhizophora mucronata TaxID=61149 RepID=A0A2P2NUM0_RHIMU
MLHNCHQPKDKTLVDSNQKITWLQLPTQQVKKC